MQRRGCQSGVAVPEITATVQGMAGAAAKEKRRGPRTAEAVLRLYHNEALRKEMGLKGRRYAEEHLSLEKCAGMYEKLLSGLLYRR